MVLFIKRYYAWATHYIQWLFVPALVGLLVQILSVDRIGEDANRAITVMYVEEKGGGGRRGKEWRRERGEREERGFSFNALPNGLLPFSFIPPSFLHPSSSIPP